MSVRLSFCKPYSLAYPVDTGPALAVGSVNYLIAGSLFCINITSMIPRNRNRGIRKERAEALPFYIVISILVARLDRLLAENQRGA